MPADTSFGAGRHQRPVAGFTAAEPAASGPRRRASAGWVEDPANDARALFPQSLASRGAAGHSRYTGRRRRSRPRARPGIAPRRQNWSRSWLRSTPGLRGRRCADVPAMRELSPARCRNLVRWQARRLGLPTPDERAWRRCWPSSSMRPATCSRRCAGPGWSPGAMRTACGSSPRTSLQQPPWTRWPGRTRASRWSSAPASAPLAGTQRDGRAAPGGARATPWRVVGRGAASGSAARARGQPSLKKLLQAAGVPPGCARACRCSRSAAGWRRSATCGSTNPAGRPAARGPGGSSGRAARCLAGAYSLWASRPSDTLTSRRFHAPVARHSP
jgi:tRNA(Ile)-lysidine synthase